MLSDLQKLKLTKMFRYLDGDKDGVLDPIDYQRMSARLIAVLAAAPGSPHALEIADSYTTEWCELAELAATQGETRVTLAVWLDYRDAQLSVANAFEIMINPYIETVFTLLDADEDGILSYDDVRRYLGVYGMREVEKQEILARIDPQQRGSFTRQEINELARQYYFSSDANAPGSWLLGRIDGSAPGERRSAEEVADWLVAEISHIIGVPREKVDLQAPITSYLMDSRDALTLAADLQDWLGVEISTDLVWDHPTVAAMSAHVAREVLGSGAISAAAP